MLISVHTRGIPSYEYFHLTYFLVHVSNACPVIVSVNPCARHLVELLQLQAADLADYTVFDLDSESLHSTVTIL